ncbi:MAG: PIN domain-containing protein [Bdellovibrionales bacterium]|nr:PIN domain-containing protein [Bdellovibrionales bacterium]
MSKKSELLFFDSNVYIKLLRSPEYGQRLEKFLQGAYLYVINKIVLMELWAGVRTKTEENILKLHQHELPLIGIQEDNFVTTGQILSQMRSEPLVEPKMRRRLTWDILIALSAKENSAVVVTENENDFRKIQKFVDFECLSVNGG